MPDQPIALVLAGGGARGAYEAGVLSVLLPALPPDQRPNLIVGSSVGAINGAYVAATLPDGGDATLFSGRAIWEKLSWGDVLATPSLKDLDRIARGTASTSPGCSRSTSRRCSTRRRWARRSSGRSRSRGSPSTSTTATLLVGGGRRHLGPHGPQRRLPPGRHARLAARRQAPDRLRPDDARRAPRARLERDPGALPGGRDRRSLVLRRRHAPERADQARAVTRCRGG